MRVISNDTLRHEMVDHPYECNPDFLAKVNFFFFSPDKKFTVAYYEAPEGWFEAKVSGFYEIDYIIEGEVELISNDQSLIAKKGDCFLIQDGDTFRLEFRKFTKIIFFIYPLTSEIDELIESFYKE